MKTNAQRMNLPVTRWLTACCFCAGIAACSPKVPTAQEQAFADQMMVCENIGILTLFQSQGEPPPEFPAMQSYSTAATRIAGGLYVAEHIKDPRFLASAEDALKARIQKNSSSSKSQDVQVSHVTQALAELIHDCNQRAQKPSATTLGGT